MKKRNNRKQNLPENNKEVQNAQRARFNAKKISSIRPPHPCPICGQMAQQNAYPFCSTRCRAIDLNRWLSGTYILPPPPQISDEEE
ncbi:hypothetical protein HNQ69_001451 [Bartonella callosciuri]|uniref:DNA gyrase inhibitor YacG n=1 Tax=Bartonella callosciuri TaxID=686223 RepID=A0A840NWK9_9HYPH|nr:DNA gyrase inhibitor YacG [Bartonella callosciuri]MBB5074313.1 hypothetical protein [Bartonella callosciuri]